MADSMPTGPLVAPLTETQRLRLRMTFDVVLEELVPENHEAIAECLSHWAAMVIKPMLAEARLLGALDAVSLLEGDGDA